MNGAAFDADRRGMAWLARNWWAIALRGVAAVVFGILALLLPGTTLAALVLLFGAYAIVEGVFSLMAAVRGRTDEPRWLLALQAIVSMAAGFVTVLWPGLTALVLLYVIAAWALVIGVLQIVAAVRLHSRIRGEGWLVLSGILSVIFGVLMMWAPGAGALALVLWIGSYAIVFGALLIVLAFRLRGGRLKTEERLSRAA
ncbi:MAG TPA: HdeD family acid-resistance protein [Methylomirabilota bacterium]|nr:HdeD family acid-resistance protein [Methylomirabilota bacterium]